MSKTGIYLNGKWYGGSSGANAQDITYSDFENLTQAQKDNGTIYFIPDYQLPQVPIKPWATATDAELVAMIQAADAGDIDLYEDAGWRVGDERVVHLSAMSAYGTLDDTNPAQDVTLVLMNRGGKELVTSTASGRTTCSFIWGMKDSLCYVGRFHYPASGAITWKDSLRRSWCNSTFKNALPEYFRSVCKEVKNITAVTDSANEITNDYCFMAAMAEVFKGDPTYGPGGATAGVNTTAGTAAIEFNALSQFSYYATPANRLKKIRQDLGGNVYNWWGRSSWYTVVPSQMVVDVSNEGVPEATWVDSSSLGICVHGCI